MATNPSAPSLHDAVADVMIRHGLFSMDEMDEKSSAKELAMKYLFVLEKGFWFYCDYCCGTGPVLGLLSFIRAVAAVSPEVLEECAAALGISAPNMHNLTEALYNAFLAYKQRIPLCGAFVLNKSMTRVVLVMPWVGKSWQMPKGKLVQGETSRDCALREVREECGLNAAQWMLEDSIDVLFKKGKDNNCSVRMFFAVGVPEDIAMSPQVTKEVRAVEWHALKDIERIFSSSDRMKYGAVGPMFVPLMNWIRRRVGSESQGIPPAPHNVKFVEREDAVREYCPVDSPSKSRAPGQCPVNPLRPTYVRQSCLRRREDDLSSPGSSVAPSPLGSVSDSSDSEEDNALVWPKPAPQGMTMPSYASLMWAVW